VRVKLWIIKQMIRAARAILTRYTQPVEIYSYQQYEIKHLRCELRVSDVQMAHSATDMEVMVKRDIINQMARELVPYIVIEQHPDYLQFGFNFVGTLAIVLKKGVRL
jgi:hypothetical protein